MRVYDFCALFTVSLPSGECPYASADRVAPWAFHFRRQRDCRYDADRVQSNPVAPTFIFKAHGSSNAALTVVPVILGVVWMEFQGFCEMPERGPELSSTEVQWQNNVDMLGSASACSQRWDSGVSRKKCKGALGTLGFYKTLIRSVISTSNRAPARVQAPIESSRGDWPTRQMLRGR